LLLDAEVEDSLSGSYAHFWKTLSQARRAKLDEEARLECRKAKHAAEIEMLQDYLSLLEDRLRREERARSFSERNRDRYEGSFLYALRRIAALQQTAHAVKQEAWDVTARAASRAGDEQLSG
jgi:hypothetical protein